MFHYCAFCKKVVGRARRKRASESMRMQHASSQAKQNSKGMSLLFSVHVVNLLLFKVSTRDSSVGRAVDCRSNCHPSVTGSIPVRENFFCHAFHFASAGW